MKCLGLLLAAIDEADRVPETEEELEQWSQAWKTVELLLHKTELEGVKGANLVSPHEIKSCVDTRKFRVPRITPPPGFRPCREMELTPPPAPLGPTPLSVVNSGNMLCIRFPVSVVDAYGLGHYMSADVSRKGTMFHVRFLRHPDGMFNLAYHPYTLIRCSADLRDLRLAPGDGLTFKPLNLAEGLFEVIAPEKPDA